jgi:16S rRNA (cytosine967-C5)-methyltransferase
MGEMHPTLSALVGLDLEERRLVRVRENLQRLNIDANIICGDGTTPEAWWDGQLFDRILLDAPCSATGVIRRHPDIKLLRQPQDINDVAELQLQLLTALWPLLADGGILLYATCSILPQENTHVVEQFIANHDDVQHDPIEAEWGIEQPYGRQLLPQTKGHDGFYYARLIKSK